MRKKKPPPDFVTFYKFTSKRICPFVAVNPVPAEDGRLRGLSSETHHRMKRPRWMWLDKKWISQKMLVPIDVADVPVEFLEMTRTQLWKRAYGHSRWLAKGPQATANQAAADRVESAQAARAKQKPPKKPALSPEAKERHKEAKERIKELARPVAVYTLAPPPRDAVIRYGRAYGRYYAIADGPGAIGPDGRAWAITTHGKCRKGTVEVLRMLPDHIHDLEEVPREKVPFDDLARFHLFKWQNILARYQAIITAEEREAVRDDPKQKIKAVWRGGKLCLS